MVYGMILIRVCVCVIAVVFDRVVKSQITTIRYSCVETQRVRYRVIYIYIYIYIYIFASLVIETAMPSVDFLFRQWRQFDEMRPLGTLGH